jgi:hypothetical protein
MYIYIYIYLYVYKYIHTHLHNYVYSFIYIFTYKYLSYSTVAHDEMTILGEIHMTHTPCMTLTYSLNRKISRLIYIYHTIHRC